MKLEDVTYKALEKMQKTYKSHRCILEIDRSFITSTRDVFHGMPFGVRNHALSFNLTRDTHEKMQNDVWNEGHCSNIFLKNAFPQTFTAYFCPVSRNLT